MNILVVENEKETRKKISNYFNNQNMHNIIEASNGIDAWEKYLELKPEIIISDLNFPKIDNLSLIKKIREINNYEKIIILSECDDKECLFEAIQLNVTDYLKKPLDIKKFAKIINSIEKELCDLDKINMNKYITPEIYYDVSNKCIVKDNTKVQFTKKESQILELLLERISTPVSSYDMCNYIYDFDSDLNINAIRTLIKKIRKKLPDGSIDNIYGGSYRLNILK